ncbi:MAG: hypothetical protein Q4B54_04900 [Coriobacteriales bacterium]|nr:hypothetical protein [Coriobacteriales bacterium]
MVKAIRGHYYVYEYKSVAVDGKRKTKMGPCIGKIEEGRGFVPNSGRAADPEITALEFGDWAVTMSASSQVRGLLGECFHADDADAIWALACMFCVRGVVSARDARKVWEQSCLSLALPSVALGERAVGELLDALGRRQGLPLAFEWALAQKSSRMVAVDGLVVGSGFPRDDLSGEGYRLCPTDCDQTSLLVAYDALDGSPLACRIVEGGLLDEASLEDLLVDMALDGALWLPASGLHSAENVRLMSIGGNDYIMPLREGVGAREDAVADMEMQGRFVWASEREATVVEWKEHDAGDGQRVFVLRDCNQAAMERSNYLRYLAMGEKGYAEEALSKAEPLFGAVVLQTSLADATAEQVWDHYKRRWAAGTYYDWLKCGMGVQGLCQRDYYRTQGLSFVFLVASLVRKSLCDLVGEALPGRTVEEVLLDARLVKAHLRDGIWGCCNCKGSVRELFAKLGVPLEVKFPVPAPAHA